jgi:hypothetical protein
MDAVDRARGNDAGVDDQHSDVGIGYRDDAQRFVIGMLWDSAATGAAAPAFMRFL